MSVSRSPVVARDVIYAPTDDGIDAVDEKTGDVIWKLAQDDLGTGALAPLSRRIYGLTHEGRVFCIEGD